MCWRSSPRSSTSTNSESLFRWSFRLGFQSNSVRVCQPTAVLLWAWGGNDLKITFLFCFLPRRHPRLPHHHSNCHLSGIPLRRLWRVYFLHPRWIQRRSQPLSRPLTCKHNLHTGNDQRICLGKHEESSVVLLLLIYIIWLKKKKEKKGNWSYRSVIVHYADGSKANQCKQMLQSAISHIDAYRQSFYCEMSDSFHCTRCSPAEKFKSVLLFSPMKAVRQHSLDSSLSQF